MFGIKFKAWPIPMKGPLGRKSVGHTEDHVAMQECARQDFVDTHPAATYIVAEYRQAELQLADLA